MGSVQAYEVGYSGDHHHKAHVFKDHSHKIHVLKTIHFMDPHKVLLS
jgi:hypothetical protein